MSTEKGDIDCEVVVNAGGMYAAEIGRMAGVRVPVVPMSHEYLVTQPFRERDPDNPLPTLRDPDLLIYYREEGGGLVMGGYERPSAPAFLPDGDAGLDAIPPDFNGRLLEEDWDRLGEIVENSRRRVPVMDEITVTKLINGPEGFTPDNEFCLGETSVDGLFVAAGFCAHGLAGAGGVGRVMAEWIAEGEPSMDLWEMDVRRFGAHYRSPAYTVKRIRETYETYYDIRYPGHERAGRPAAARVGGEHVAPRALRRVRREVGLGAGELVRRQRGRRRRVAAPARLGRAALVARDRRGAPRDARARGAFDESSFSKMEIAGPGAAEFLEGLCDNHVARGVGQITYTQMLNRRGGIECDFTVARLARGAVLDRHGHRVRQPRPGVDPPPPAARTAAVQVHDVTAQWSCFGVWGPRARDVLSVADPVGPVQRSVPLHVAERDHGRATCPCARCG